MSKQSRFYQVTNQVLLEYSTDQYKIQNVHNIIGEDESTFYMYQGLDGNQYCAEKTLYNEDDAKSINNINDAKYPNENDSDYYYGGKNIIDFDINEDNSASITGSDIYINGNVIGTIIKNKEFSQLRTDYINHDTIKLYLSSGYVMNNIAGYSVKVKGKILKVKSDPDSNGNITVKRINDVLTLLDWFMPKEELKNKIHWLTSPLYMNSCFYDRYIEIKFPSPLDCAMNNRDIYYVYENTDDNGNTQFLYGNIEKSANIIIEFATIQPDNITFVSETTSAYESNFTLDVAKVFSMNYESNANYFNVRLYEDPIQHAIIYYPVYGTDYVGSGIDTGNPKPLDIATMQGIETGAIPIIDLSSYDSANDGMDDFIEMYGDNIDENGNVNVYKWIIINELSVTYNYNFNIESNNDTQIQSYSEYYTNTIDYSGKTEEHGKFYESKFIPFIQERNNMTCRSIVVRYTAHLFNRMNNIDIVRTASMAIKNPYKYGLTTINTNNIMQYKIVNKIDKQNVSVNTATTSEQAQKYIRSYYDTTNITIKNGEGNTYNQGQMTLYLYHEGNNYLVKLYGTNADGTKIPLDLSGSYNYKMCFPSISSANIQVFPNKDSQNYNLSVGSLVFYITKDQAKAIMEVPRSERYFAIKTHIPNNTSEESVIYEGSVEWYAS